MTAAAGRTKLHPVTRANPCAVCRGDHKCSRGADGVILCGRESGDVLGFVKLGAAKGDEQFTLYRSEDDPLVAEQNGHKAAAENGHQTTPDLLDKARTYASNLDASRKAQLAETLGLPASVLESLPLLGWSPRGFHPDYYDSPCFTFPEVNAAGKLIGLSCRYPDGAKKAMAGGRRGLTMPARWREGDGPIYLPEGQSNTLAFTALGLTAIGRPSNRAGVELLHAALWDIRRPIIVVCDWDPKADGTWPGLEGKTVASELAQKLEREVYWCLPPDRTKDVRAWVNGRKPDPACQDEWQDLGGELERILLATRKPAAAANRDKPLSFDLELIDSAAFDAAAYPLRWLIRKILVQGQPAVIGGPKKSLKTSLLCDLAISIGAGKPFLGMFDVPAPAPVGFISGESGPHTIQETARRVCWAKGIELPDAGVWWGFRLPLLSNLDHLDALGDAIRQRGLSVVILDPLFLCLLTGNQDARASSMFDMGPLYATVSKVCLDAGALPILCHHFHGRKDPLAVPELEDLAFAGISEFARQWLLVGRREKFSPGSGQHKLWFAVGGSTGHSGCWALDIDEGILMDDFTGRIWQVSAVQAAVAVQQAETEKEEKRVDKLKADEAVVLDAVDVFVEKGRPPVWSRLRDSMSFGSTRFSAAAERLIVAGLLERFPVTVKIGSGASKECIGLRRLDHRDHRAGPMVRPDGPMV